MVAQQTVGTYADLPFWNHLSQFNPEKLCDSTLTAGRFTVFPGQVLDAFDVGIRNGTPPIAKVGDKTVTIPVADVVKSVGNRNQLYVFYGCIRYTTLDIAALTIWCGMVDPTTVIDTDISKWTLLFCPYGNYTKEQKK